jgi:hypothetical protein
MNERSRDSDEMQEVTRPFQEGERREAGSLREAWIELSVLKDIGKSPERDQALLSLLEREFRVERASRWQATRTKWGKYLAMSTALTAAIGIGIYGSNEWMARPPAVELAWDDDFLETVVRVDQAMAALPGVSPAWVELEPMSREIQWVESLGNADSF